MISYNMTAKTYKGLEYVLAKELISLGAKKVEEGNRLVSFRGTKELMYRANLHLRTAVKILKPIKTFTAENEDELYEGIKQIRWSKYLSFNETFAIDPVVNSSIFTHSQYAGLKSKDAIVDQFREKYGTRPNVNTDTPNILINLHINESTVNVSLDSSGEPLFKRGYRKASVPAPINEVMAAGIIALSGWKPGTPFIDPMCGSGTFLTEAALIACNLPSNLLRKSYTFQNWKDFDEEMWRKIKAEVKAQQKPLKGEFLGLDIDEDAVNASKTNLRSLGLSQVNIQHSSFFDLEKEWENGMIIMNPPYDERLKHDSITEFYSEIGSKLKHHFIDYDACVFSGNLEAMKHVGLEPIKKADLLNGAIESVFHKYDLYEGGKRPMLNRF